MLLEVVDVVAKSKQSDAAEVEVLHIAPLGASSNRKKSGVRSRPLSRAVPAGDAEYRFRTFLVCVNNLKADITMLSRPALQSLVRAAPTHSLGPAAAPRQFSRVTVRPVQRSTHNRQPPLNRRPYSTSKPPPPPQPHYSSHAPKPQQEERLRLPTDVPPISERLKPLIPFLFWWTVITSLAVHLLRKRKANEEELARLKAQQSVLEDMIRSFARGEALSDEEIRRELEMVGLRRRKLTLDPDALERVRQQVGSGPALVEYAKEKLAEQSDEGDKEGDSEKPDLSELRKVSWLEVLLGRRRGKKAEDTITEDGEIVKLLAEGKSEEEAKAIAKERVQKKHEEDAVKEWTESESNRE